MTFLNDSKKENDDVRTKNTFLEFGNLRTPSLEQFLNRSKTCPADTGNENENESENIIAAMSQELAGNIRLDSVVEEEDCDESSFPLNNMDAENLSMLMANLASQTANQGFLSYQPEPQVLSPVAPQVMTPEDPQENEQTTVMLRNIPNKYTQSSLLETMNKQGLSGKYDFFYLPVDFKNGCNMGYCFVNFTKNEYAIEFMDIFKGYQLPAVKSVKVCDVCWARVQGLVRNVEHYRNSPVNDLPDKEYRPLIFEPETGKELVFPRPDASNRRNGPRKPAKSDNIASVSKAEAVPVALNRIFIGGLATDTSDQDISNYFSQFGPVAQAEVIRDKRSHASRGFGFCTFESEMTAEGVLQKNRHWINGQSVGIRLYSNGK